MRDNTQMKIRLEPNLKQILDQSAKANGRSLNAEITARLSKSIEPKQEIMTLLDKIEELAKQIPSDC